MANMTLSIPDELYSEMKQYSEVKWSEVARNAIVAKIESLKNVERANELVKKSKLTQKDVDEFSKKIKASATKRALDEYYHRH